MTEFGAAMAKAKSWGMTDEFWQHVETLIPQRQRVESQNYSRKAGGGAVSPKTRDLSLRQLFMFCVRVVSGRRCPLNGLEAPAQSMPAFSNGKRAGVFEHLWRLGLAEYDEMEGIAWRWQSIDGAMMKAPMAQQSVGPNPTDRGKKGSKRHLLVDGRGVPLSLVVTRTNRHDVSQLEAVLDGVMVNRPNPSQRRNKHLCADAGYTGTPALKIIEEHGCIPHVKGRGQEANELNGDPKKNARRWVVEVAHSWFNRFRKLLVRYEKLDRSFIALNHLAASIMVLRKIKLDVNIIYG